MPRDPTLTHRARGMRGQPTPAEQALWRFRRQHPVPPYIVDFACVEVCVAVETDGGQHADSAYDAARDGHLRLHGWRVLRFWNNEVLDNPDGVAATILREIGGARRGEAPPLTAAPTAGPPRPRR